MTPVPRGYGVSNMRPCKCTCINAIAQYAELTPNAPAVVRPNGTVIGYKELWAQIAAVGRRLEDAKVESHETIAVLLNQGALQILAVAGVLNCSVCAPLHPRTSAAEVKESLIALGATAMIVSAEFEAEAEVANALGLTVLIAHEQESPASWQIRRPISQTKLHTADTDAILILTTSATSGSPKRVPLTAVNLDAQAEPRVKRLRLTSSDRLLQMTSLSHSMGIDNSLAQFSVGGAIIATEGFDPTAYLRWLDEIRPTWYDCVPTVHQAALECLKHQQPDPPISLRFVQSAGAPLPSDILHELERILRVPVLSDYGMTETGPIATDAFLPGDRVPYSVGRTSGLEIGVMNSFGKLLLPNEEGEIVVRGPAVFAAYTNNPEANLNAFRNHWFCTGDLGRLDQEGNLFLTGRSKEMINRGGEKIVPAEVDAALATHPAIRDVAAFAVPHPTLGEDVACAVVLDAATEYSVSTTELRRYAARHLAAFKVPRRIYFVSEIPRGEQGKPQRWLLFEKLSGKHSPPPLPIEVSVRKIADDTDDIFYKLHEIWARILDRNDLGFDEDFFNAGGDSLSAINMLVEVDQRFGSQASASAASFFDEPTLVHLTGLVGKPPIPRPDHSTSNDIHEFVVRDNGSGERIFCIPADGDEGLYFRRLATHLPKEMSLSIFRPMNTFYSQALFSFECAGCEMARMIRQVQPTGPYLLGGFCYGGIVAVEAARNLRLEGQHVQLILFDVPMPGFPGLIGYGHTWIERARRKLRAVRSASGTSKAEQSDTMIRPSVVKAISESVKISLTWATVNWDLTVHRLAWHAVVPFRKVIAAGQSLQLIQRFLKWAQQDYFPFYRAKPLDAPILHFLCTDEPQLIDIVTRFGWRKVARNGIEERYVPHDHSNLLHESNLPEIASVILQWSGARGSAVNK
jgi:acyl-CoA synthetase (AMP-forming)/AMP-acid ligase II/thioesterase domain-containing protein